LPLLQVANWKTHFRTPKGTVRAVDGVSLELEAGQTLGVVGESGSGKTVLARSIMGLLPKRNTLTPGDGAIAFSGEELQGLSKRRRRAMWGKEIAMIFQNPMTSLNPVLPIGKQITESLELHLDMSRRQARSRAVELLRSVGIPEPGKRVEEYPHQLSGGMRQRVTIAIAISCNPRLLLADEPTTALDVTVQAQILDLLDEQRRERHMAMILVTHDLGVVAGRADTIVVMYAGQVVERAPTRTLFKNMRMPYTEGLWRSIPSLADKPHTRLSAVPGRPPDLTNPPEGCRFSPRCPYAQERCLTEAPPLVTADEPGQEYRCWFPVGTAEGRDAMERNLARGRTAAGLEVSATSEVRK